MAKLYELTESYQQLLDYIDNEDVDIDTFKDTIEAIESGIEEKFENIAKLIKNTEGDIKVFKEEEKRLSTRRKSMENKVDYLKKYLLESLQKISKDKVETGTVKVRKQKNPDTITISEGAKLPEKYLIPQEAKVDTSTLKEDVLKNGVEVEGVEKAPTTYHIRIS